MEQLQSPKGKEQPPMKKLEDIFHQKGLRVHEKFTKVENEMIMTDSPVAGDLVTIINWTERNKPKNPLYEENLEKTETKAINALIQRFKDSPDPKKWSETIKNVSKSEGLQVIELLEKKILLLGEQKKQTKEAFKKGELTKEIMGLDDLHTKLGFLVKNIH